MAGMAAEHGASFLVCVTGPECSGKTTLAHALATELGAPLVAEAARAMLDAPGGPGKRYTRNDVLAIAWEQLAAETAALASGAPVVIADTDLSVIRVWWEERYGALDPWLAGALRDLSPRRYLLALPDLPWVPDSLREAPRDRARLLARYRLVLGELGFPHAEIGGTGAVRFERALAVVEAWIRERASGATGPAR
jgi:nicotinamide riboside kinase